MNIDLEPGELYLAEVPRCPVHGRMRTCPVTGDWVCHGYDGEGCDRRLTDAEWAQAWKPIGRCNGGRIIMIDGIITLHNG